MAITITDEDIRQIYREISAGVGKHGSFLTHFAEAVVRADSENFELLRPAAARLIVKYNLKMEYKQDDKSPFIL
jgi:hypothetical protein